MKINIAMAGGSCTGKSTLAARLFAELKEAGFDYDLVTEESRKLAGEFGKFRNVYERFYMWRQQEREEKRSKALDGFITDQPLLHFYIGARQFARNSRDAMAVRELLRMCFEIKERYQLIVIAKDTAEIPYKTDQSRRSSRERAEERHCLTKSFVEHFWPEKLFVVQGNVAQRMEQVIAQLTTMRKKAKSK